MAEPKEEVIKTVVTDRGAGEGPKDRSILHTPAGQANVEIVALSVWAQVGIRVLRTFLQGWVGILIAGGTGAAAAVGVNMPVGDFGALLVQSASLAVAPAVISALQNIIELLGRVDVNNPGMRA